MPDFKAKKSNFNFGRGSAPDIARVDYSAPPDLLTEFNGLLLRDWRRCGKWECYGEGKGKEEAGTPKG